MDKADKIQKKNIRQRPRDEPLPGTERKPALSDRREFAGFRGTRIKTNQKGSPPADLQFFVEIYRLAAPLDMGRRQTYIQINRYDAEGLRYEIEENSKLVQFIYNENKEKEGQKIKRLIRSFDLWASECTQEKTWYHYASDEQGSIVFITDENEIKNRCEYDAWGNTVESEEKIGNRYRYTGQQYDPITQQYYLRARYYNPVIARFTQEDEYRGDGLNLYAYCDNNPVMYYDPSGYVCDKKYNLYKKYREQGMSAQEAHWKADVEMRGGNKQAASQIKAQRIMNSLNRDERGRIYYNKTMPDGNKGGIERPRAVSIMVDSETGKYGIGYSGSERYGISKGTTEYDPVKNPYTNPTKKPLTKPVQDAVDRIKSKARQEKGKESFVDTHSVDNCAEVNAANNLQSQLGRDDNIFDRRNKITVLTIENNPKSPNFGGIKGRCENCQRTFDEFNVMEG